MKKEALGVDIGNVIIDHRPFMDINDEVWWQEKYSSIKATDDVFACLKELNEGKFKDRIFLVSKLKPEHDKRTKKWLSDNKFFEKTGINPQNVYFVRERKDKDIVCQKLRITHFIDDRLEVLSHMIKSTPHLYLFQPDEAEVQEFKQFLSKVTRVVSWKEVMEKIK